MGRIEGTGPKPRTLRSRIRRPRISLEPLAVVTILSPVVILAHDTLLVAVLLPLVLMGAYLVGYHTGRGDLSRELLDDEVRRVRRDVPAA